MEKQLSQYLEKTLTPQQELKFAQTLLEIDTSVLSSYFHDTFDKLLELQHIPKTKIYIQALNCLLSIQSLKYTFLFVTEKILSQTKNSFHLFQYLPNYLGLPNIQLYQQNVIKLYSKLNDLAYEFHQNQQQISELLPQLILKILRKLKQSKYKTNIKKTTVLLIMNQIAKNQIDGESIIQEYLNQYLELIEIFQIGIQDTLIAENDKLAISLIQSKQYDFIFSEQKKLEDLMKIFIKYKTTALINKILLQLSQRQLNSLQFRSVNLKTLVYEMMNIIGTNPDLKSVSTQLIHKVSSLPLPSLLQRELWFQLALEVSNWNFKSYCLKIYKQISKNISPKLIIQAEMLSQSITQINSQNLSYVGEFVNFLYYINSKIDVKWMAKRIQSISPCNKKSPQFELIDYCLGLILETDNKKQRYIQQ